MKYSLKCKDCNYETPEDKYYINCPKCNGFLEVNLLNTNRKIQEKFPSIFKYQDFMTFDYNTDYDGFENITETPEFFDEKLSEILDVEIIIKDETVLPTGTWKDKEGFISIFRLLKNNINDLYVFSSGNTGTAIARSASIIKKPIIRLVIPKSSKSRIVKLKEFYNPDFVKVQFYNGSNDECIKEASKIAKAKGIIAEGGFNNYARREGIKLVALEHYLGKNNNKTNRKIDWYCQPIAGGIGIYSFHKACKEIGIDCPKMLGVQADICSPMVNAWNENSKKLENRHIPKKIIPSDFVRVLRTRNPGRAYEILKEIMDECNGSFNKVSEKEIYDGLNMIYESDYFKNKYFKNGILVGLEPSTSFAGLKKAIDEKVIKKGSKILFSITGAAKDEDVNINWIKSLVK